MRKSPEVSVVMSVYNGAQSLGLSLDSVLSQEGVDLEFVVVNDGSTDETATILDEYASVDNRMKVIHQGNKGLTQALICGCENARGEYIARQDTDDSSLPRKLYKQLETIRRDDGLAFVSCGTRFVGPGDEFLHEVIQTDRQLLDGLSVDSIHRVRGPSHHASVMFRRDSYQKVGGYRSMFPVAQDLDLWLRLIEYGSTATIPEALYIARISPASISNLNRDIQVEATRIILECRKLRSAGADEESALGRLRTLRTTQEASGYRVAKGYYFVGRCLQKHDPRTAYSYYRLALKNSLLHHKSWWRLLWLIGRVSHDRRAPR